MTKITWSQAETELSEESDVIDTLFVTNPFVVQ